MPDEEQHPRNDSGTDGGPLELERLQQAVFGAEFITGDRNDATSTISASGVLVQAPNSYSAIETAPLIGLLAGPNAVTIGQAFRGGTTRSVHRPQAFGFFDGRRFSADRASAAPSGDMPPTLLIRDAITREDHLLTAVRLEPASILDTRGLRGSALPLAVGDLIPPMRAQILYKWWESDGLRQLSGLCVLPSGRAQAFEPLENFAHPDAPDALNSSERNESLVKVGYLLPWERVPGAVGAVVIESNSAHVSGLVTGWNEAGTHAQVMYAQNAAPLIQQLLSRSPANSRYRAIVARTPYLVQHARPRGR